jgi:hypothetical protein
VASLPATALAVLTVLISLTAFSHRAQAAPVIETEVAREFVCVAGSLAPQCLALGAEDTAGAAFGLLKAGGLLLSGAAASAITASESIAPVPLPAAGWLLLAGLGGLGLFGRRRQNALPTLRSSEGGIEPLAGALLGGGYDDMPPAAVRAPALVPSTSFHDRLRALMNLGAGLWQAFAPGRTSPARPCGGAGMLWAATAERAPPMAAAVDGASGVLPRVGRHGRKIELTAFMARTRSWISSGAARLLFVCDALLPHPALRPVPVAVHRAESVRRDGPGLLPTGSWLVRERWSSDC